MASAPIIMPILILIVLAVAILLILIRIIQKLFGCPNKKASYPFDREKFNNQKNYHPTLPNTYTIEPSSDNSTASPNSVYNKGGMLLYPSIAVTSAPSRSPSPHDEIIQVEKNNVKDLNDDKTIVDHLETVDNQIGSIADSPLPISSNSTREDSSSEQNFPQENSFRFIQVASRCGDDHFESDV